MSKTVLLTSASFIIFSAATYANPEFDQRTDVDTLVGMSAHTVVEKSSHKEIDLSTQILSEETVSQKLPADLIVDFAKFSYSVDKKAGWQTTDKAIYNKLINDGWVLDAFDGTTGTANNQVESVSGLLAFRDNHVVIATRGTEMTNWNDWMTNFRFSRSPITRFFAADEQNKLGAITAQFFGGVDGEVANGFLQTHLSSWDYIKEAIIKRAEKLGISTKDMQYTITGHSKGAAKAQLNALNLLTDSTLGVGVDYLEKSFIVPDLLGESGFYGISQKTEPQNKGNVDTVVFESPRVFSDATAEQVNNIIGKDNLVRVESRNSGIVGIVDTDIVTHVTPAALGFNHAGTTVEVNGKGFSVGRHMMGNVGDAAIPAIEAHRATVAQKATSEITENAPPATKSVSTQTDVTESAYFGKSAVDAFKGAGSAVTSGFNNLINGVTTVAKKAWGYFWN